MEDYGYHKDDLRKITTFLFDVDGVLAKSNIIVTRDEYIRQLSTRDGFALRHAIGQGFRVGIITGGRNESVRKRFHDLGVQDIYIGVRDKLQVYQDYIHAYGIDPQHILYMGDDIPDYEVMKRVGFPACPEDAVWEIKNLSKYISPVKGGEGCVRDVVEQTLKVQGKWQFLKGDTPLSV